MKIDNKVTLIFACEEAMKNFRHQMKTAITLYRDERYKADRDWTLKHALYWNSRINEVKKALKALEGVEIEWL